MTTDKCMQDLLNELTELGLTGMVSFLNEKYGAGKSIEKDKLDVISEMVGVEYAVKMSTKYENRLKRARLNGCPQNISECVNTTQRTYFPENIAQTLGTLDFVKEGLNVCILGPSDSGKTYLAKAIGIHACKKYRVLYCHCQSFLEEMVALKQRNFNKYQKRVISLIKLDLLILDDFLLHTINDENELKILFEIMEKRSELTRSIVVCSQREPKTWTSMMLQDEVSSNAILKRATKHYTVVINVK